LFDDYAGGESKDGESLADLSKGLTRRIVQAVGPTDPRVTAPGVLREVFFCGLEAWYVPAEKETRPARDKRAVRKRLIRRVFEEDASIVTSR